jgi:Uma2 family endonuclease
MALHDLRRPLTYEDYLLIPEDGRRHEILDGEHCVTPSPFLRHQRISIRLSSRLFVFADQNGLGEVFTAPSDVILSRHDVVQPDLFFIARDRARIATEKNVQGAPDLVVEILSKSTRRLDQGIKLQRYERLGVGEYWILDPDLRGARVHRRDDDHLRLIAELLAEAGDVLTTPLLPGLVISLREIFA